jgi:hypothetical protein
MHYARVGYIASRITRIVTGTLQFFLTKLARHFFGISRAVNIALPQHPVTKRTNAPLNFIAFPIGAYPDLRQMRDWCINRTGNSIVVDNNATMHWERSSLKAGVALLREQGRWANPGI